MKHQNGKLSIASLAALILLGVFAVGIFSVLFAGADTYKRLTDRDAASYDGRTCVQYLAAKVRQAPVGAAVEASSFGESDSLLIREVINDEEYWTQVYLHDGWMMELFTAAEAGLSPEDGEKILPVQAFFLDREGDLLQLDVTDSNGKEHSLDLFLRGGEEVLP